MVQQKRRRDPRRRLRMEAAGPTRMMRVRIPVDLYARLDAAAGRARETLARYVTGRLQRAEGGQEGGGSPSTMDD